MIDGLVLSIFSGIDLLGKAFTGEGYCVVGCIDTKWGSDVREFHPPAGAFEGVIGGDPCQHHSRLAHLVRHNGHEPRYPDMTPEYTRIIEEAQPNWFVRENVPDAPLPRPAGYDLWSILLVDAHVGGLQPRQRRICFGMREGLWPDVLRSPLQLIEYSEGIISESATLGCDSGIAYEGKRRRLSESVLAGHGAIGSKSRRRQSVVADSRRVPVKIGGGGKPKRSIGGDPRTPSTGDRLRSKEKGGGVLPGMGAVLPIEDACEAMGLPRDFTDEMPFTMHGKRSVIGNGVPMAMGRAIARAVREAAR